MLSEKEKTHIIEKVQFENTMRQELSETKSESLKPSHFTL